MLVLRPVVLTDLPQLQRLARESLVGIHVAARRPRMLAR
jgi:arginine/ornithine N-succinyltransferase beta subunit